MTIRVAVLGLGVMGRQHLRILSDLGGAEVLAASDAASSSDVAAQVPILADWREVLELRPDAVVNALPTGLHFEVSQAFLDAGIHVLVEKPIATTVREARELSTSADRAGVVLMVGHVERFNPVVETLRGLVRDGRLGRIVSASARRVGVSRPAIPHANVALDLAIHDIDVLAYLLENDGRLLLSVGSTIGSNQLEDHVDLTIRYGETIASIQANWITPVKIRRLELTGTKAYVQVDYIRQSVKIFETIPELIKGTPWDFFAVSQESKGVEIVVPSSEPLRRELEHFLECIRLGATPMSDVRSATKALALAIEATDAARGMQLTPTL